MPIGGKLVLKGGETLGGVEKKKKKKSKKVPEGEGEEAHEQQQEGGPGSSAPGADKPKPVAPTAVNVQSGKNYEQEFELETQRMQTGKTKSTPWGSSYRAPPEILHGYTKKVTGKTAEERLDLRSASKADKFCK